MKRTFERRSNLPAFWCDLATFEAFINELNAEFSPNEPRISIHVDIPGEELSFDSTEDLKSYETIPASIANLWVSVSDPGLSERSFRLSCHFGDCATVTVEGPSESWCAGIVEKTKRFAKDHRTWYWFIRPWFFWILSSVATIFAIYAIFSIFKEVTVSNILAAGTLVIFVIIATYLFVSFQKVFKPFVVIFHFRETWVKKHSTELMVVAAIVSALAALYTALKK